MKGSLLATLFVLGFLFQGPAMGPGVVAKIDGEKITRTQYLEFLYLCFAQSRLPDLIEYRMLEKEAKRLGVLPSQEEVEKEVKKEKDKMLRENFHGNKALMEKNLLSRGYTLEEMENWIRFDVRKRILQERIIKAQRKVTPEDIKRKFEDIYGLDGERVIVRHIQVLAAPFVEEELKKGKTMDKINMKDIEKKCLEKARRMRKRLEKEPFWKVCVEESDDPLARAFKGDPRAEKEAGLLKEYNYQLYGGEFADAVRKMKPGEISGPVAFRSNGNLISYHIIKLEDRIVTRLEDVRDQVRRALMEEPPSFIEKLKLREKLLSYEGIVTREKPGSDK